MGRVITVDIMTTMDIARLFSFSESHCNYFGIIKNARASRRSPWSMNLVHFLPLQKDYEYKVDFEDSVDNCYLNNNLEDTKSERHEYDIGPKKEC